jgi:hypothetical protein
VSNQLDAVQAAAATYDDLTVTLNGESLAVFYFAQVALNDRDFWLDHSDMFDEITDSDWDAIQELVANAYDQLD